MMENAGDWGLVQTLLAHSLGGKRRTSVPAAVWTRVEQSDQVQVEWGELQDELRLNGFAGRLDEARLEDVKHLESFVGLRDLVEAELGSVRLGMRLQKEREGAAREAVKASRARAKALPGPAEGYDPRSAAVGYLVGARAHRDRAVALFRERFLGDEGLEPEDVGAFLTSPLRTGNLQAKRAKVDGRLPYTRSDGGTDDVAYREGSILSRLHLLVRHLAQQHGWLEAEATTFVLTGIPVYPAPFRCDYAIKAAAPITLRVMPWVSEQTLIAEWREVQRRIRPGGTSRRRKTFGRHGDSRAMEVLQHVTALAYTNEAWPSAEEACRLWNDDLDTRASAEGDLSLLKRKYAKVWMFKRDLDRAQAAVSEDVGVDTVLPEHINRPYYDIIARP